MAVNIVIPLQLTNKLTFCYSTSSSSAFIFAHAEYYSHVLDLWLHKLTTQHKKNSKYSGFYYCIFYNSLNKLKISLKKLRNMKTKMKNNKISSDNIFWT